MKYSRVSTTVIATLVAAMLQTSSWANEGKVIVDNPGVAGEPVTVTIFYTGQTGKDTVTFTPAAADVANATKKAELIALQIKTQATSATSAAAGGTATVTSKGGATIRRIVIDAGKSKEKDRVNPSTLASLGLPNLQFELTLAGAASGSFLGTVDIGGPSGQTFTFNTQGLSSASILSNLEASIDPLFPSFVSGDSLIITNVGADNTFLASFDDPELRAVYSMAAVPEPSSVLLMTLGGGLLLVWSTRRSRQRH